jgi:hypothetical protein
LQAGGIAGQTHIIQYQYDSENIRACELAP